MNGIRSGSVAFALALIVQSLNVGNLAASTHSLRGKITSDSETRGLSKGGARSEVAAESPAAVFEAGASVWQPLASGVTTYLWDVHFTSSDEGWVAGSGATLLHTTNGGASWVPYSFGISGSYGFHSVRFLDQNTGWVGGLYSIARTLNRGATWSYLVGGAPKNRWFPVSSTVVFGSGPGSSTESMYRYTFNPDGTVSQLSLSKWPGMTPMDIYFIDSNNGWSVGSGGGITRIANAMSTFPSMTSQSSGVSVWLNAIKMLDQNTGWIAGDSGTILHTTDGGATWLQQYSGTAADLYGLHFLNASQGWIVGTGGVILSTTDGGASWASEPSGVSSALLGVWMLTPDLGYVTGAGGTILKKAPACLPPSITSQPFSQTIASGQSANLGIEASGTGPFTHQWYQGVSGDTSTPVGFNSESFATPILSVTTPYWVRVSNACGSIDSSTATITVVSGCLPAFIALQPQSTQVSSGQSVMLTVIADGSTPLSYQWFQGVSGDTSHPVGTGTSTFITPPITAASSYWVRVANACGSVASDTAVITIQGSPGPVVSGISSKTSKPGAAATIKGSGFSSVKTKDIVYFGSLKAKISKASFSALKVKIPKKAKTGTVPVYVVVDGVTSNTVLFTVK